MTNNITHFLFALLFTMFFHPGSGQPYQVQARIPDTDDTVQLKNLWKHCGNRREITVVNLANGKTIKKIQATAENGYLEKKGPRFILVPRQEEYYRITLKNKKTAIGELWFNVAEPPSPEISFLLKKNQTQLEDGSRIKSSDTLSVRFTAEHHFHQQLPSDARYRPAEITVVRHGNIRKSIPVPGDFTLESFQLNKNETIKLELNSYYRINFREQEFQIIAPPEVFLILKVE